MLSQLLLSLPPTSPLPLPSATGKDNSLVLLDLCEVFHALLRRVPRDTVVFLVLDGVVYCERQGWGDDYGVVVEVLGRIASDDGCWSRCL